MDLQERPAYWGDLGSTLTITGALLEAEGHKILLLLPESDVSKSQLITQLRPTTEEWSEIIRQSDNPDIFEMDDTGNIKAIHRKLRYNISGAVQQKVWARDNFKCVFCGRTMGDVQLTVDHLYPLEKGGANNMSNYVSACRKCNKHKGNQSPETWCEENNIDLLKIKEGIAQP
jgi:hypothetical protein